MVQAFWGPENAHRAISRCCGCQSHPHTIDWRDAIEPVKFAVVGIGGWGRAHLESVADVEAQGIGVLDAVVVIDPENHPERLAEFDDRGVRVFPDLEALLDAGGVDVITLPIGIHQHVPLSIQCLEAGYPVIVEKPLAGAIQDADRLLEVRNRTGKTVIVGYQHLYSNTIQTLKEIFVERRLGAIRTIGVEAGWPRPDSYYARNAWAGTLQRDGIWVLDSPVNNALAHYLTNVFYLCGATRDAACGIETVQAELYRARQIESLDTVSLRVRTDAGVTVTIAMSHVTRDNFGPLMEVTCEKGTVNWWDGGATIDHADGSQQRLDDGSDRLRSRSFANMVEVIRDGAAPLSTPEIARVQTLCINGAHESCPEIHDIPDSACEEVDTDRGTFRIVDGLDEWVHRSADERKLLSEVGVSWARRNDAFDMRAYNHYPSSDN